MIHGYRTFVFTEIFTFVGNRVRRIETFHINVGNAGETLFAARTGDAADAEGGRPRS